MSTLPTTVLVTFLTLVITSGARADLPSEAGSLERVVQTLVTPPGVPEHTQVAAGPPKVVQVRLTVIEKELEIGGGAYVQAMTFNGSVPGPLIVIHQNDYQEITLVNSESNTFLHNIDFHAATSAMGTGGLAKVIPGQEVAVRFKATKTGIFAYHCAPGSLMTPYHVVTGMNGSVMVLPRDGLKDNRGNTIEYDRAFYIGEQGFYVPHDNCLWPDIDLVPEPPREITLR